MKCDTRIRIRRRWRNHWPFVAALQGLIARASLVHGAESPRCPNIVILFADDMNFAGPSCYGGRWGLETPHIDRLAQQGVRCTNAYVSAPTCGPSRAGLVTGRQQCRFGHEFNSPRQEGIGLPLTEATIGDRMGALGYRTGVIGKWHLGGDETCGADYHPLKRGFDEFFGFYGSMVWFYRSNHIFRGTEQVKDPGYLTDVLARESCDFIRRHRDRPFLLYTALNAVHTPLEATERDLASVSRLDFSAFPDQEKAKARAAMLLALDRAVGQIMETLQTEGLDEHTLVFFTNDNGNYNGGSGYRYKPKPGEVLWALYNLADDPGERHDLKEEEPAVFSQLKATYDRWEGQLPEPLWPFGGSGQMGRW